MLLFTAKTVNAQWTSIATAAITIITPINIAKNVDMSFGNMVAYSTTGTVILSPDGARTKTGGVALPATVGTITAASFTISGQANYTYAITLPSAAVVLTNGSNTMNANTFTCNIGVAGLLSGNGTQIIKVGATLGVGAWQATGTYVTSTPFDVTVNYN